MDLHQTYLYNEFQPVTKNLQLRVDGNLLASETFMGTINSNEIATYQFTTGVDLSNSGQTYTIEAKTNLAGDGYTPNDPFTKDVTHLLANDVGVLLIASPQSGEDLGDETVTVRVKNYGASTQSGFNVQYSVDGATPVVESFAGNIESEEELTFSFSQTADLSAIATYNFTSKTLLAGDQLASNDESSVVVDNLLCQPNSNCGIGHGFRLFEIAEINNASGCEAGGYGDFTGLTANLAPGSTNNLTVTSDYGGQHISVWIDFNDSQTFTADEVVVDNYEFAAGQGAGTVTETFDLVIPAGATIGAHRMRARSTGVGTINNDDACEAILFGETEDYTANIGSLGVNDLAINDSSLIITSQDNKQFEVSLESDYDGVVYMGLYNLLGQQLGTKLIQKDDNNTYLMKLNMESAQTGVYLIRVGGTDSRTFKTARIIVK